MFATHEPKSNKAAADNNVWQYPDTAVAVVGVACRFAGADSLEEFWQVLESGATHIADIPKDRFPDFRFERRPMKRDFKGSCMNNLDAFDHKFFNVSSREAAFRDPQQRLALEVTYQALESAGHFSRPLSEEQRDMGCYIATSMNEYHENVVTHAPSAFSLTGSIRPFIAGQVSHFFGFTGPAVMLDAACAASGVAVNIACRAVASGECKSAIAGATNTFISPDTFQDLACGHFTSPTGPSTPFDVAADGYGRGEGVAAIVLKRLSDAVQDGDVIKGVISATATNQCANDSPITVPHGPTQSALYRKALKIARLDPSQIGYVEAHGTGTRVGDPIEARSIRSVFGDASGTRTKNTYLGSLKSNIGHTEATSGLSGLIKVMTMIEKRIIPKQALFNKLHPDIAPLEPDGLEIAMKSMPWVSEHRAACVNNYGASGSNAVMILTQPPAPPRSTAVSRPRSYPVSITAFSGSSLNAYCSALLDYMNDADADDDLALDIAFHLSRRRNPDLHFSLTSKASSARDIESLLRTTVSSSELQPAETSRPPTVLFFGGQSGKPASVSADLYDACAVFRNHLNACDSVLQTVVHQSMFPSIFAPSESESSVLAHAKLFSIQYASAKAWIDCGVQPSRLIGHSFGQLTALCVARALSLQDGMRLITGRARLIDEKWGSDRGSMIAIEATHAEVVGLVERQRDLPLEIACHNGARSFVLAGPTPSVDAMETSLKDSSGTYRFRRLQVSNAFHTILADALIEPLRDIAEQLTWHEPSIALETCSEGSTWSTISPPLVASHIRDPVYFHHAVQRIAQQVGPAVWIEAGSGQHAGLLRRALEPLESGHNIKSIKIDAPAAIEQLADQTADLWRSNLQVQFWPFHPDQRSQFQPLNLPPYQFDKTRHWLDWQELGWAPVTEASPVLEEKPFISLVRETDGGSDFEVNTQFESWRESCAENRILGVSTCPTSLLVDLISEAISTIQRSPAHISRVQQLRMSAPLPAEMNDRLTLRMRRGDAAHVWTFQMTNASSSTHEFASGIVLVGENGAGDEIARFERLLDMAQAERIEADTSADCVRGNGVYKLCSDLLQFPQSSHIVRSVHFSGKEAAAVVNSQFACSPMGLGSVIQVPLICLNSLHERAEEEVFINNAVQDAQFRRFPASKIEGPCSLYIRFFELAEPEVKCDIYMFDSKLRRLCGIVSDASFARMQVSSLRQALEGHGQTIPTKSAVPVIVAAGAQPTSHEVTAPEAKTVESSSSHAQATPSQGSSMPLADIEAPPTETSATLTQPLFEVLERIADVDASNLHSTTTIADLGIDSLMGMEVADEISKTFSIDIEMSEFIAAENINALCQLVAARAGIPYGPSTASPSLPPASSSVAAPSSQHVSKHPIKNAQEAHQCAINLDAAYAAFDRIRADFDDLARETGCDKFWAEVHPAQMRLIIAHIVEAFAQLGCDLPALHAGASVPPIQHDPATAQFLQRILHILQGEGLVVQSGEGWLRSGKRLGATVSAAAQADALGARFPQWAPEHELLHIAGTNLAGHFAGTTSALKVLFGGAERRKLMADQYLVAPIQSAVSRQLARFIQHCFALHSAAPVRVLEVGGGTCGTTMYALEAFAQAGIPVEYTFTDISPAFITAAKTKLNKYDSVKYQTLDVTKVPDAQLQGAFDMIIATNVIHATPNVAESASNIRKMLSKTGIFTLVEYTDVYAAIDVIFGQLDGWWAFNDGRTHATMSPAEWEATLRRAGFDKVDWTGSQMRESHILRIIMASE